MDLKKKEMNKNNWKRVIDKDYVDEYIFDNGTLIGVASLLKIKKISSPSYKTYGTTQIKIADLNYYWLQIGLIGENYWITAMYDENKQIVQYYIDITYQNLISLNGNSSFYDLFLDVVKLKNGQIYILDEDELEEAFNSKIVGRSEYDMAYEEVKKINSILSNPDNNIEKMCSKYFEILIDKMK